MDEKQRRILDRNFYLLVKNLVLTEEFYDCLRRESVLPETMIKDIESKPTREERNGRLLETLQLRGGDAYRRFRHVLYLTGHTFLADHLYGEDNDIRILKGDEIFSKFPAAFNTVSDDVKSKLLKYLETKVKERSLTTAWLKSGPERTELMEARKVCYDNEKDFRFKLNTKNKKIQSLRDETSNLTEELKKRNKELNELQKHIEEMKQDFKDELNKQSRFNAANNSSVIQLRQRFDSFSERIKILNITLKEFLADEDNANDDDEKYLKMSTLEQYVRKLLRFARENEENTSSSIMERDAVLRMLKTSSRQKHQPLSEVVKSYIEKQEKGKLALYHELERLLEITRGKRNTGKPYSIHEQIDLKILKSQAATLRVEIEHMRKKLDWKDSHISDLVQENTALRSNLKRKTSNPIRLPKLSSNKARVSPTKSIGSPDSAAEMENVYQQFDKYISDSGYTSPPYNQSRMRRGSLADVNLERHFTPPPLPFSKSRRSSRIDNVELDILDTGRRPSRDVVLNAFKNIPHTMTRDKSGQDSVSVVPVKTLATNNAAMSEQHLNKQRASSPGKNSLIHQASVNVSKEGRKPSLADLVAVYENIQSEE